MLQPPKGSGSHQGEHPELSLVPEQGWASWRGLEEPWGWAKCERSSRAPSTAHVPSSLARLWGHTGWVGAQADCQSQRAGGPSARPCSRHCTQASKRNTGKDNSTCSRHRTVYSEPHLHHAAPNNPRATLPCPAPHPQPWSSHLLGQHRERTEENNPKTHKDAGKVLFHTRPPPHRAGLRPQSKQRKAKSTEAVRPS